MIDYTNYKKFYSSGDEYNIAILDQETSCIKTTPLSSSLVNYNAYISELIYSPDGYVRMYVNGYYVEWEAFEQDHGVLNIAYDEYGERIVDTIGGVGVYWGPVYVGLVESPDFTYDPETGTVYKTLLGVNLSWSANSYTPSPGEVAALTSGIVVGVGTLNEQYVALTSEGTNFTGLVEVNNGVAKTFYTQQLLEPKRLFSTDLALSKFTYDRLVGDTVTLPYSLQDVSFEANDYLTYNLIKDRLTKLHINNTYVFSRMFIPNNDLPASDNVRYLGVPPSTISSVTNTSSAENLTLYDNTSQATSQPIKFENVEKFVELGKIKSYVSVKYAENTDTFVILGISDTKFISLSTDLTTTNLIEVSDKYETVENELPFGQLNSICLNTSHVFISDFANNNILKYEIAGFFNKDLAFANQRNFIEVLGGSGYSTDPSRFNGPSKICCTDSYLVVYDSGNYTCKIFNTQFNYIKRLSGPPFRREPLAAMEFDTLENRLYVLTYYNDGLKLYIYDDNFILQEQHILEDKLTTIDGVSEVVKNISFAKSNNNYWYICTDLNVFQKLKNRPEKILGRFQFGRLMKLSDSLTPAVSYIWNLTDIDFDKADVWWNFFDTSTADNNVLVVDNKYKGIGVINNYNNEDDIVLLTDCRLYVFKESYTFKQVTKYNTYPNYGASKLTINRDEYVQTTTINKELYKILNDIYTLKNNLVGRFTGSYDALGVFTLEDYNYNINFSDFNQADINQYYIHDNEKAILGVINRAVRSVYELQSKLVSLTNVDYRNALIPIYNLEEGTLILE
jgi:hypothetical protein